MCVSNQRYSPMEHALLAGCGGSWRKTILVMFNAYIDDSGTDPNQKIAIASALIIPALAVKRLESEWDTFRAKYGFSDFHASECVARNSRKQFSSWSDDKVHDALARIRQITKKYSVAAFSFAVQKADFEEIVPENWKDFLGRDHYVWAIWHVLKLIRKWGEDSQQRARMEFIFDMQVGKPRRAVEKAMADMETVYPGRYVDHYAFRPRKLWPPLQCCDLLAWSCYCVALRTFHQKPLGPFAEPAFKDYSAHASGQWLVAKAVRKEELRRTIGKRLG